MDRKIKAVFENGVFRPLQPLEGLADRSRVDVTITSSEGARTEEKSGNGIRACIGTVSDSDAAEMTRIIDEEFAGVDPCDR